MKDVETTKQAESMTWAEANQHYLMAALVPLRLALQQHAQHLNPGSDVPSAADTQLAPLQDTNEMSSPPALELLCSLFHLSTFERAILLLCAGMELDSSFASLCSAAQGSLSHAYPTFALALAALPEAHWSALMPNAALRYWRLIELNTNNGITSSPLRIDERILHYLTGLNYVDERLAGLIEPVEGESQLVPSHQSLADRLLSIWMHGEGDHMPVVQLCGSEVASKRAIALAACRALGIKLYAVPAYGLPTNPAELEAFTRLWEREVILCGTALLINADNLEVSDTAHERSLTGMLETLGGAVIVCSRERRQITRRTVVSLDVDKPTTSEQRAVWRSALGAGGQLLNGKVEILTSQFNLSSAVIAAASAEVMGQFAGDDEVNAAALQALLWDTCRTQARSRLDDLAQRLTSTVGWDDLVLPETQRDILRDIALHVRERTTVYETWGFAAKGERGLGISALFAGVSGTGKTMAAEVLANELRLDLYRIDLSQVVSKYIGETEKNLRRVFDAAEEGGAILLFDEADALFGKRSEVKDSHDRYANIEVGYLLQRMEAYRGLAILTTNMKNALDTAFLRRLRFIVQFPFPDAAQRAEIWRRIFPASTPTQGLDMARLARLNITGGHIRNIALNAAFLAAGAGESVRMTHLLRAARAEYAKMDKLLTEAEIGGWL